ncbi:hypothetical protein SSX86_010848 [Deinandra increscens subsp. villosa]|uniref:Uncharacterized protein n=1 Tax=Deinandra increscens subsp. villosa TaxID=3103831 RepID=A0AAP0D9Q0_9ASTR
MDTLQLPKILVCTMEALQQDMVATHRPNSSYNHSSHSHRKYGAENTCTSGSALSKAAVGYSSARMDIERERENLLKSLGTQVVSMENLACSVIVYKDQTFVYVLYCCEFDINHDFIELLDVS